MKTRSCAFIVITIVILFSGCNVDLNVENLNEPDRDKVLSDPNLAENYLGGSYYEYWTIYRGSVHIMHILSSIADEITTSWCVATYVSREPRIAWDNDPSWGYQY